MFITVTVVFNLWHFPITLPYLGAIMILITIGLTIANNDAWHELDDKYYEYVSSVGVDDYYTAVE